MFVRKGGEMRGAIDFAATHAPSITHWMATHVTEVASADSPQQFEIDYDSRLLANNFDFVIFIARQELQPLAPGRAHHPPLGTR